MTMNAPPFVPDEDSLGLTQERFGFTVFLSICVHVVLILGVGFTYTAEPRASTSLEITLATYTSAQAPDDADFLAQANQLGSGSETEALAPASTSDSPLSADSINDLANYLVERPTQPAAARNDVVAVDNSAAAVTGDKAAPAPDTLELNNLDAQQTSDSIASLRAQLDLHRQEYAKRPRRYTLTSASTKEAADAAYLDAWRKRIETVGNQNYPQEATNAGIYGTLRLMVSINPDGSVSDIRILRSSGEPVLDAAAVNIVQVAAPFEPFPPDLRARVDILEVIRTWQFQRGDTFSSF